MVESLTLAIAGGIAGLVLAVWIDQGTARVPARRRLADDDFHHAGLAHSLLFNFGVSLLTGIIFGLVPALQSTRPHLAGTLKDQVGSIAGGTSVGLRKTLVAAQVTLSLLLLIGAGLFIRSLQKSEGSRSGLSNSVT